MFHYIEFKTYCHATENMEKVKKALFFIAGQELEIEEDDAEGYFGNPIKILEGKISRNQEMDAFFERLPERSIKEMLKDIPKRVDERCNFYLRFDKDEAYQEKFEFSRGSNTIRVRARVESYPASRDNAIEKLDDYLSKKLEKGSD